MGNADYRVVQHTNIVRNANGITADVGIAAWNYYRVSQDLEWRRTRGYPMLKATADFGQAVLVEKNWVPSTSIMWLQRMSTPGI